MIIINNIQDFNKQATKINQQVQFAAMDFQELTEQTLLAFSDKLGNQIAVLNRLLDIAYDSHTINTPLYIKYIQAVIPHKVGKKKGDGRRKQFFNKIKDTEYLSVDEILQFIKNHPHFLTSLKKKEQDNKEIVWDQEKQDTKLTKYLEKQLEQYNEQGQTIHLLAILQNIINTRMDNQINHSFSHDPIAEDNQNIINNIMSDVETEELKELSASLAA